MPWWCADIDAGTQAYKAQYDAIMKQVSYPMHNRFRMANLLLHAPLCAPLTATEPAVPASVSFRCPQQTLRTLRLLPALATVRVRPASSAQSRIASCWPVWR